MLSADDEWYLPLVADDQATSILEAPEDVQKEWWDYLSPNANNGLFWLLIVGGVCILIILSAMFYHCALGELSIRRSTKAVEQQAAKSQLATFKASVSKHLEIANSTTALEIKLTIVSQNKNHECAGFEIVFRYFLNHDKFKIQNLNISNENLFFQVKPRCGKFRASCRPNIGS